MKNKVVKILCLISAVALAAMCGCKPTNIQPAEHEQPAPAEDFYAEISEDFIPEEITEEKTEEFEAPAESAQTPAQSIPPATDIGTDDEIYTEPEFVFPPATDNVTGTETEPNLPPDVTGIEPDPVLPPEADDVTQDETDGNQSPSDTEVAAEFGFAPISETECEVACTNKGTATYAEIPSTAIIDGVEYSVTQIDKWGFSDTDNLREIMLPESVKTIEDYGFMNCTRLISVDLKNVETLGSSCFSQCTTLESVTMTKVKTLGNTCFAFCAIETVTLQYIETLGTGCFAYCRELKNITLQNVETLDSGCFIGCSALESVTLQNVETLGGACFANCTALESVTLQNVKEIRRNAFSRCVSLAEIVIPESVEIMGYDVFYSCNTQIKVEAFTPLEGWDENWNLSNENQDVIYGWNKSGAEKVYATYSYNIISDTECEVSVINKNVATIAILPAKVTIGGVEYQVTQVAEHGFDGCANLKKVSMSYRTRIIKERAFANCPKLEVVAFVSVTEIGDYAFDNCAKLVRLIIPKSVKTVGAGILNGNNTKVYINGSEQDCGGWSSDWNSGNASGLVEYESTLYQPGILPA